MSAIELPIIKQWRESFGALQKDGRRVTVQGSAWLIRDATIHDVHEFIVVLDVGTARSIVSYDSIAGISFEHYDNQDDAS